MAHFAKINTDNIVVDVVVVKDSQILIDGKENEEKGVIFLNKLFNSDYNWKQTSYNTSGGVHKLGGTPFRKNYGGIGYIYDEDKDAFYTPQPYSSWTLNEETCQWECPVVRPSFDATTQFISWNEENIAWDILDK